MRRGILEPLWLLAPGIGGRRRGAGEDMLREDSIWGVDISGLTPTMCVPKSLYALVPIAAVWCRVFEYCSCWRLIGKQRD